MAKEQQNPTKHNGFVRGAFLATLFLLFCWQVVQATWFFNLEFVEVRGNETLSTQQVEEVAGLWKGAQLLKLDLREMEKRLVADPRVVSAQISRILPNKVRIVIEENIGMAVLPYYDGFVEIDPSGRVVSIVSNFSRVNLPIVSGVHIDSVVLGQKLSGVGFESARTVMSLLPSSTRTVISELNVSIQGEVTLTTTGGIHIKIGTTHNAAPRLALLPAVLYAYEVRGFSSSTIAYIDMTGDIPVYKGR
ncbi:MAG: cell division protein FtsQ [Bacillota bacterium]|nr:MAG: cell division protein FtsQ [Bacillota bacterium]MBS3950645.1 FtsQ-type POTRA domain-containing protein [Peptococcaceae bacterium]